MQAESELSRRDETVPQPVAPRPVSVLRVWLPASFCGLFWLLFVAVRAIDKPYFVGFLYGMASAALLTLAYFVWWFTNRSVRWLDRTYGFLSVFAIIAVAVPLCHASVGVFGLLTVGVPVLLTVRTLWMGMARKLSGSWIGSLAAMCLAAAGFTLIRLDGLDSNLNPEVHWRWQPSAEDLLLAEKAETTPVQARLAEDSLTLASGDWAEFRGRDRAGVVHGIRIAADWQTRPPRLLWRQRVGPAWSSVIVVGDHLFTQEQRGPHEAVVCYDAGTGHERWIHQDIARFWETVSGAGPRATPTFANGQLFTLGGTGILNCLDAATGKLHWSRQIAEETSAPLPMWGFAGSPLVVDGNVIVFAGGPGERNLLAYRADSGEPSWAARAGPGSYSSPQFATLNGTAQCLLLSDRVLTSVDSRTGKVLWEFGQSMAGAPRVLQPCVLSATQLLVATLQGPGLTVIDVARDGDSWKVVERLTTTKMKPEFPDLVVHQGHAYGFDTNLFCCVDLASGDRLWKQGRYGRGQVLLLADQGLLLVLSEKGEAVLLKASPERHEELTRFQALEGKTWNHPVIAHGRLYVRNAEQMACYDLMPR
jgi:outer membrane protein assembly factor BamB